MKKKSGSRIGRGLKKIFNLRAWSDFDRLRAGQKYISSTASRFFVLQSETVATESFDEAKVRLKLTDADLLSRQKGLLRLTIVMLIMAIIVFVYSMYHVIKARYPSALLSFAVSLLASALAFRYHFWYFQFKQRKLGCTVKEWFRQGVMHVKPD